MSFSLSIHLYIYIYIYIYLSLSLTKYISNENKQCEFLLYVPDITDKLVVGISAAEEDTAEASSVTFTGVAAAASTFFSASAAGDGDFFAPAAGCGAAVAAAPVVFALNRPQPPSFLGPLGMARVAGAAAGALPPPRSDCSVRVQGSPAEEAVAGLAVPPFEVELLAPSDSGTR